jgi:hypothetical protein
MSQTSNIYEYLKSGGRLSSWNARDLFKTVCLPKRISDVEKKYNENVDREWKVSNDGARYLEYYFKELKLF